MDESKDKKGTRLWARKSQNKSILSDSVRRDKLGSDVLGQIKAALK
ncbi:MAG: hypothetical protein GX267_08455 [Fibrobacter sp.]|nr:hypothetical protein [Fibrobacter sp.]